MASEEDLGYRIVFTFSRSVERLSLLERGHILELALESDSYDTAPNTFIGYDVHLWRCLRAILIDGDTENRKSDCKAFDRFSDTFLNEF